jgi:hypothetical protein
MGIGQGDEHSAVFQLDWLVQVANPRHAFSLKIEPCLMVSCKAVLICLPSMGPPNYGLQFRADQLPVRWERNAERSVSTLKAGLRNAREPQMD